MSAYAPQRQQRDAWYVRVDGKISQIRVLDDGKFAYWRGVQIPASVLTREELKVVQRLNGRRLLLPYAFFVLGAVLAFLSAKSQLPFIIPVLFSVIAIVICTFSMRRAGRRIERILNRAPRKHIVGTHVPISTKLGLLWRNTGEGHLLVGTLLTGTIFVSAAFGTIDWLGGLRSEQ